MTASAWATLCFIAAVMLSLAYLLSYLLSLPLTH